MHFFEIRESLYSLNDYVKPRISKSKFYTLKILLLFLYFIHHTRRDSNKCVDGAEEKITIAQQSSTHVRTSYKEKATVIGYSIPIRIGIANPLQVKIVSNETAGQTMDGPNLERSARWSGNGQSQKSERFPRN